MATTSIEWTDRSWNFLAGCSLASPGCTNCYAAPMAARIERMQPGLAHYRGLTKPSKTGPQWTGKVAYAGNDKLMEPLRIKKPAIWFVNSMSDLFHEDVSDQIIDRAFAVMALCPQHTFQVLTKRAKRMREYLTRHRWHIWAAIGSKIDAMRWSNLPPIMGGDCTPLPNVWLGVSIEDQTRANERLKYLINTPAAVRWVSAEPLLGPLDLTHWFHCPMDMRQRLDWVVVGGESGPRARPMHPDWVRSLRDQCAAAGVPFFFKQWGEFREFDTGPPPHIEVDNDSEIGDAYEAAAVNPHWINAGGDHVSRRVDIAADDQPWRLIERVGKTRAGRLLDGVEHNAFPRAIT